MVKSLDLVKSDQEDLSILKGMILLKYIKGTLDLKYLLSIPEYLIRQDQQLFRLFQLYIYNENRLSLSE